MTIKLFHNNEEKFVRSEILKLYYETNKINLTSAFLSEKSYKNNNKKYIVQFYYTNNVFNRVRLYNIILYKTIVYPGTDNILYTLTNKKDPEIFYYNTYIQKWSI